MICYLGALPTCTYGGDYIVTLMNEIAVAPAILLVVFVECIAVSWFYGKNNLYKKENSINLFRCKSIFNGYQGNDWYKTIIILANYLVYCQSTILNCK
jgi:SNF family Na+-dependent transporter